MKQLPVCQSFHNSTIHVHSGNSTVHASAEVSNAFSLLCHDYLASKMWCLGRYLPFLFGDVVEPHDVHWEHYLNLLTIMDYIFAPGTYVYRW